MNNNIEHTNIDAANDILGQFYCAFGQGAGAIRIQRSTIAALRSRYFGPIAAAVSEWESSAPHVLSFMTQVGRLAALLATQSGRTAISPADFVQARQTIEAGVHKNAEQSGKLIAGPYCPVIIREEPAPAPTPDDAPSAYAPAEPVTRRENGIAH